MLEGEGARWEVLDAHCHIASTDFFPRSFLAGAAENIACAIKSTGVPADPAKILRLYESRLQDADCSQLLAEMDVAGIQKAVLLLADFTFALRDCPLTIAEMIDRHKAVLDRHTDRLFVFAGVDPRWGQDGVALFERAIVDYGFHGLKVYPPCGFRPSDRLMYPYYEICAAHHLPVLIHVGATSPALAFEHAQPIYVDAPARDFPSVDFILAHGGVHCTDECVMLCSHRPNVYLDVSGFEVTDRQRFGALFRRGVNHKVLFGTDWPVFRMHGSQKDWISMLLDGETVFPETMALREKRAFFSGTAQRLLARRRE